MPNTSVLRLIVADMAESLNGINGEDGGYNYSLIGPGNRVSIYGQSIDEPEDLPAVIIYQRSDEQTEPACWSSTRRTAAFSLVCVMQHGEGDPEKDPVRDFYADIIKALRTDHTRGGNAELTEILGFQGIPSAEPDQVVFSVELRIEYRHAIADAASVTGGS